MNTQVRARLVPLLLLTMVASLLAALNAPAAHADRCEPSELPLRAINRFVFPVSDAAVGVVPVPANLQDEWALVVEQYESVKALVRDYEEGELPDGEPSDEPDTNDDERGNTICETMRPYYPAICPNATPQPGTAGNEVTAIDCAIDFAGRADDPAEMRWTARRIVLITLDERTCNDGDGKAREECREARKPLDDAINRTFDLTEPPTA